KMRDPGVGGWSVAIEQSFNKEMKLVARPDYEAAVADETGPFAGTDKSGKSHQFSVLALNPLAASALTLWERVAAALTASRRRRAVEGLTRALDRADDGTRAAE
ncbi:MAG: hypothetical protein ACXWMT_13065, partial [Candidatus Binataceae bacterium]